MGFANMCTRELGVFDSDGAGLIPDHPSRKPHKIKMTDKTRHRWLYCSICLHSLSSIHTYTQAASEFTNASSAKRNGAANKIMSWATSDTFITLCVDLRASAPTTSHRSPLMDGREKTSSSCLATTPLPALYLPMLAASPRRLPTPKPGWRVGWMRHPPQPPRQPTNALLGYRWMDGRQAGFLALRSHACEERGLCVCVWRPPHQRRANQSNRSN